MLGASHKADVDASRRIRRGTRAEDMQEGPPLVELQQIDSAFQLTEHLKALHNEHTQSCRVAIDKATAQSLAQPPPGVDRGIWLYELCRFLTQKANMMACALFADDPPCSAATCPEMRASEWQYLCAAHEPPKSCCAIDYCCHTLDWCATALTSTKLFPSRLGLGTETLSAQAQIRKMTEVFRRVYRIFAHAWFSHRDVFWRVESKTGLYLLFKTVCDEYRLIPEDNYTIPPEAEGIETTPVATRAVPTILQRDSPDIEPAASLTVVSGNTTKRHRHTMSHDRSVSVSTVIHEEVEEDEDGEQPTGHGPLLLTRVETARHEDGPPAQQEQEQEQDQEKEQEIPAEDPPPYAEDSVLEQPEKSQLTEEALTNPETDAAEASASNSTPETKTKDEKETDGYPSSDPPSYAEIASTASTSETKNDTAPTSAVEEEPPTDSTSPTKAEPTETSEQDTTRGTNVEDSEPKTETEDDEAPAEKPSFEAEDEAAPKPSEVANSDAADETEATKTVAD
ncbi:Mob1/phocein [Aureobasidium namibiae CBS 147.97]|uniref:Mob1/phocein n=1 Tax=Aureobasidium namibiae CBS 147.97 TaxID=1043004 RepID=A0A074WQD1_9PEZI|nr:Mob1/phocein [Aureobasidium namibiae CBS 147.97]KEQ75380.1 Mob1/phocein [Aureobasidium namibiae CBS 147.97]